MLVSPIVAIENFKKQNTYCILIGTNEDLIITLSKYIVNLFDVIYDKTPDQRGLFDETSLVKTNKIIRYNNQYSYLVHVKYLSPKEKKALDKNIIYVNCYEDNINFKLLQIETIRKAGNIKISKSIIQNLTYQSHLYIEHSAYHIMISHETTQNKPLRSLYHVIYQILQNNRIEWYLIERKKEGYNEISTKMFLTQGIRKLINKKLNIPTLVHFKDDKIFKILQKQYDISHFLNILTLM